MSRITFERHPTRRVRRAAPRYQLQSDLSDLTDTTLKIRMLEALGHGATRYPLHRKSNHAIRRPLELIFDDLALHAGLVAQRLDETTLLLDGDEVLVDARGARKPLYSSITLEIWARSADALDEVRSKLLSLAGQPLSQDALFTIDWHFTSSHMGLTSVAFEELADAPLIDAAYPSLGQPVSSFVERYLVSHDTVLILQGPPGTGKTRLVRAILAAMSLRKGETAKILYTSDRKSLESDELFVEFITGSHDAFVLEDADHLLQARANGNIDLRRFLAIADGVVRAQGRKIIFTTNLPNLSDIDPALLRPGRCHAAVKVRALDVAEAGHLLHELLSRDPDEDGRERVRLPPDRKSFTVAEVYRLMQKV